MYSEANIRSIYDLRAALYWLVHYTTRLAYAGARLAYGQSEHSARPSDGQYKMHPKYGQNNHTTNLVPVQAQYTPLSGINTRKTHNLSETSPNIPRRNASFYAVPEDMFCLAILHNAFSMPVTSKFPPTPEDHMETPPANPEALSKYPGHVFA